MGEAVDLGGRETRTTVSEIQLLNAFVKWVAECGEYPLTSDYICSPDAEVSWMRSTYMDD